MRNSQPMYANLLKNWSNWYCCNSKIIRQNDRNSLIISYNSTPIPLTMILVGLHSALSSTFIWWINALNINKIIINVEWSIMRIYFAFSTNKKTIGIVLRSKEEIFKFICCFWEVLHLLINYWAISFHVRSYESNLSQS